MFSHYICTTAQYDAQNIVEKSLSSYIREDNGCSVYVAAKGDGQDRQDDW